MESGILSFGIRNTDQEIWNPNNDRNPEFYSFTEKYWNPVPYYMKFWRHVNLAILKNPYLATLQFSDFS